MITLDNIEKVYDLSLDDLCNELDRYISLDSKQLQNLYIIKVLNNQITKRIANHAKY